MSIEAAQSIAKHFGITVLTDDAPKIIRAIQNAYAAGIADEREACAKVCDVEAERLGWPTERFAADNCAAAIRARSQS